MNGSSVGTDATTASVPATTAPLSIGNAEGAFYVNGLEDEVCIYNRALTATEIQSIYAAASGGKCNAT